VMHDEAAEQEATALTFDVAAEEAGARLDAYLATHVANWSRTRIHRLIEDGDVLVEGRTVKPSRRLRAGEQIEVELTEPPPSAFTPEDIPIEVVYEDDDLIVVNKQAGLVVHPAAGVRGGTLANALAFRFRNANRGARNEQQAHDFFNPKPAFRDPQSIRPGIVHRLDKDTSGLIVVAKTESAHEHLSDQFRAREVFKSYVTLVHGRVQQDTGRIEQPIARDPRHRTRMAVAQHGRPALSLYRVRQRFDRFTLLDVEIKTGRTHQIRVHLAWLKHPVIGDETYNAGRDKTVPDARVRKAILSLGRLFLHAERLGFRHPRTNEPLRFTAPLPPALAEFLSVLYQVAVEREDASQYRLR
jgi:23S rRNA pseudouridine1911/1915/1917 synthase